MSLNLILLAPLLVNFAAGLPIHSVTPNISARTLAKRTTANPPFDGYSYNQKQHRSDGDREGDVFQLSKCYCVDTPSRDLPPVYGQYYGSYYGFDYYNYHQNRSYAFSWTCASGELETLNGEFASAEYYFLAPKCLSWMEEEKKECWDTGDGNEFCAETMKGKDNYYWNGQKRRVHNHPAASGMTSVRGPDLDKECQRMCQTVPANTDGWMQDMIPSDHENKINLATATQCNKHSGVWMAPICGDVTHPGFITGQPPKVWETWNYIETYSDQADMCKKCA